MYKATTRLEEGNKLALIIIHVTLFIVNSKPIHFERNINQPDTFYFLFTLIFIDTKP